MTGAIKDAAAVFVKNGLTKPLPYSSNQKSRGEKMKTDPLSASRLKSGESTKGKCPKCGTTCRITCVYRSTFEQYDPSIYEYRPIPSDSLLEGLEKQVRRLYMDAADTHRRSKTEASRLEAQAYDKVLALIRSLQSALAGETIKEP